MEDAFTIGDHTLFVGKVVAAQVEKEAFDETWLLADPDLKPLHYLGLNYYATLGERLEARVPSGPGEASTEEQVERGAEEARAEARELGERGRGGGTTGRVNITTVLAVRFGIKVAARQSRRGAYCCSVGRGLE